jgi:phage/plasmid primase-like uncharacterized protein
MYQTFFDALCGAGFVVDCPLSGELQRFAFTNSKGDKDGWVIAFQDGSGIYGDWRNHGVYELWRIDGKKYNELSLAQRAEIDAQRGVVAEKTLEHHEARAAINLEQWNRIELGTVCEYLERKKVKAHGIKIDKRGHAYVAARDINGKLWNYQDITTDPKRFQQGRVGGCFSVIEGNTDRTIIASGYATGATIHEKTGYRVVIAFGDSNVLAVAREIKSAKWKGIVVACDNDSGGSESGNKIATRIRDELGLDIVIPATRGDFNDLAVSGQDIYGYFFATTPIYTIEHLLGDTRPMPEDVIEPRVLTQGGMLVFGGAPKVGKSDFMLSWLMHMAAGKTFMDMRPPRPLKVFYMQAEVQYDYLRERVQCVDMSDDAKRIASKNMVVTPQLRMILNEDGVNIIGNTIKAVFHGDVDIIAIDPISNVYDGESENDNAQMMMFLQNRVEGLRAYARPETGFMLVHHTKKISKDELAKDPFQMFSGASSLRRYYTTGMLMYRPDEEVSECVLTYEVRNGARIDNINVDKLDGRWCVIDKESSRIGKGENGVKGVSGKDLERKLDAIAKLVQLEAASGRFYTKKRLSEFLAGKHDLGSDSTIRRLIDIMLAQHILDDELRLEDSPIKYLQVIS